MSCLAMGIAMPVAAQFGSVFNLSSLDGSNGFVLNGIDAEDQSGYSVSHAGDINHDGIDDLIVGARFADPNGNSLAGESYVIFGGTGIGLGGTLELSDLNGSNGFVLNGLNDLNDLNDPNNFNGGSGSSVSYAGDINHDGIDDLIIGAIRADSGGNIDAGATYVVFGGSSVGSGGTLELGGLNGSNGFTLNGVDADDRLGGSASYAGDINHDGIDDLIVGAYFADPGGNADAGASYVVFGGSGVGSGGTLELSDLNGSNGFVLNGIDAGDELGRSASYAGDINHDGIDDLIVGAYLADSGGNTDAGASYVVFGGSGVGSGGTLELSDLNGSNGFVLNGVDAEDLSGLSVRDAGDLNGDSIDDLIVGAIRADPGGNADAGASYVVFGGSGVGSGGTLELSDLNGSNGFVLNGVDVENFSGISVSRAGDINHDGIDDLIIGATGAGDIDAGASYVVFGGPSLGSGGTLELNDLNGNNGFVLNGVDAEDISGLSVSHAGDINHDGIDDLVIGAYLADPNGDVDAGESYVVFGVATVLADVNGDGVVDFADLLTLSENFGGTGAMALGDGDLNGDGTVDITDLAVLSENMDDTESTVNIDDTESGAVFLGLDLSPSFNNLRLRADGDLYGDGVVDIFDLAILANGFGPRPAAVGVASVPEPGSLVMLSLGGWVLASRRYCRNGVKRSGLRSCRTV